MAKDFVIVKGKVVKMNDAAFQIASKHFGATKNRPAQRAVPIELLKMPKLPIIPANKIEVKELHGVEIPPPVQEPIYEMETNQEAVQEPVKTVIAKSKGKRTKSRK
jgi:hypothetical protein